VERLCYIDQPSTPLDRFARLPIAHIAGHCPGASYNWNRSTTSSLSCVAPSPSLARSVRDSICRDHLFGSRIPTQCFVISQCSFLSRPTAAVSTPMASPSVSESPAAPSPSLPESPTVAPSYFNPVSPLWNALDRFNQWRADLGLPHPGSVENLQKEVKGARFSFRRDRPLRSRVRPIQPPISTTTCLMEPAQTSQKVSL
jgi:hypothetical protein